MLLKLFLSFTFHVPVLWYTKSGMSLFIVLMLTAAFLGTFRKTRDGLLWGLAVVLVLLALSAIFPDSPLTAALQTLLPFTLRS